MSKSLVFFGTEDFSLQSLKQLIKDGWDIKAVVTKTDTARGRGQKIQAPAVKKLAEANSIPVFQPAALNEITDELMGLAPTAVLVSYGKIVPKKVIDIFENGIVNVHPSLLPKYRGPAPIEAAILNGDTETGVSLMKLTPEMDAGPIYVQKAVPLSGNETKPKLYQTLSQLGAQMLSQHLLAIIERKMPPKEQDEAQATYTKLLRKPDGYINWQEPSILIERKVRAFLGYPKTRAQVNGYEVIITGCRIASDSADGVLVLATGDGFIEITKLIAPSGRQMNGADFVRGYCR